MKCICPKCDHEFFQFNSREAILNFIKDNPGCSASSIQWEIRMDVKNVMVNVRKLEEEGLVRIDGSPRTKKGRGHSYKLYLVEK